MDLMNVAVNPEKELYGAPVKIDDETTLVIARYNNPKFRRTQAKMMEPLIETCGKAGVTTEQADEVLSKVLAECILLGWDNLKISGQVIPYTHDNCLKILRDARFVDFKERVMIESQKLENFRLEALEEDLGNFEGLSITTPDGQPSSKSSSNPLKRTGQGEHLHEINQR